MELDAASVTAVIHRLKRAQGQLAAVTRMLEEGEDCKAVVTQLSAVSKALDRAGFAIIASGMEKCLAGEDGAMDRKALEKLFLTLA
ncbi:metal-sensitive transcriptional regulator [Brachybacterium sp. EE-P12]|uniref:metal-sensitive transcriptional regulator n=1 Tax=Brachybacterium sp. EE-P12 TaxID=2306299 RepID=UPI000F097A73|nr:metal-sensitive transcriptional regulator [Brachybacterium sp. EE-P12]